MAWEMRNIENTLGPNVEIEQFRLDFLHRGALIDVSVFCINADVSALNYDGTAPINVECSAFAGWDIGEFRDFDGVFLLTSPPNERSSQKVAIAYR